MALKRLWGDIYYDDSACQPSCSLLIEVEEIPIRQFFQGIPESVIDRLQQDSGE